ncbi:MAG: PorP/SprF family type IX secretion system membrane protein [Chitinophagales bacterium]|nr:PorP/SprF family type IX secretion system membrane protein [Chitinophagales bacterium]MDW8394178.1 PorP/SprF family type IX secretion system membrane protein [Chitinophagales bacterium]
MRSLFLFLALAVPAAQAQDIHFSQFYAAPLVVNPALTGAFGGDYRFGLNYRSQWSSVTVPYRTFDLFGDFSPWRSSTSGQYVSLGALLMADRAGDGDLTAIKTALSGAYHLLPDLLRYHDLTLGLQVAWVQKQVDFSKFYFDNQWNDSGFDPNLPSGENFVAGQTSYADVAAGISYTYAGAGRLGAHAGFSVFHLLRPRESFYEQANRLGLRPVAFAGLRLDVTPSLSVSPAVFYEEQKQARELLLGGMMRYDLNASERFAGASIYGGLYGRMGDALIAVAGYELRSWRLLISYDVNTSALKAASKGRGAVELSLVHTGLLRKNRPLRLDLPCPRF